MRARESDSIAAILADNNNNHTTATTATITATTIIIIINKFRFKDTQNEKSREIEKKKPNTNSSRTCTLLLACDTRGRRRILFSLSRFTQRSSHFDFNRFITLPSYYQLSSVVGYLRLFFLFELHTLTHTVTCCWLLFCYRLLQRLSLACGFCFYGHIGCCYCHCWLFFFCIELN